METVINLHSTFRKSGYPNDITRPRILIFNEHFCPAFRGGGPIQSIANLVNSFHKEYEFYIVCSAYDLNQSVPMDGIVTGQWQQWENKCLVYYWDAHILNFYKLFAISKFVNPDIIYLNGVFSIFFNLLPLAFLKQQFVIAPRGMLFEEALAQKAIKKGLYLNVFKKILNFKKVLWQAVNDCELRAVIKAMGNRTKISVAQNIPRAVLSECDNDVTKKQKGNLNICYISIISAHKNLELVLKALKRFGNAGVKINLDIYGPVKDYGYWEKCVCLITNLAPQITVSYKGIVRPEKVSETISQYHALVLPSKSENFGHIIYEALASNRPVITSYFTPWQDLEKQSAGWNIDISNENMLAETFEKLLNMDQLSFNRFCKGAKSRAVQYLNESNFNIEYNRLFDFNARVVGKLSIT